jgi:hypothetical protein
MGKPKSHQKVDHVPGPPKKTRQGQGQHSLLREPTNFLAVKAANHRAYFSWY